MSLPAAEDKRRFVEQMFDRIAPRYDLVNRVMTFGVDRAWRRRAVRSLGVGPGQRVIDLGCGTGDLVEEVSRTGATVAGVDVSFEMIVHGRRRMPEEQFFRADAQHLPFTDASFDGAVSGFALRNFAFIPAALAETARVLKPGARLAVLEVHVPDSKLRRAIFETHFKRVVPFIGQALSRGYAYRYLAASTAYLPEFPEFGALLHEAGFADARQTLLLAGAAQLVTARRADLTAR
jgi:demethylmenaquinone methyltransferase/2-methoxy-6-polyprenyl-1,4-benzoquinol methylase